MRIGDKQSHSSTKYPKFVLPLAKEEDNVKGVGSALFSNIVEPR